MPRHAQFSTALLLILTAMLLPALAGAMSLDREGAGDKICTCDFTSAMLTVEGKQGEQFAISAETDGQLQVNGPLQAEANTPTRLFLSVACDAKAGAKLFQISARSLDSSANEKKLFSLQAVDCPKLEMRQMATTALCPTQADFEMELENTGLLSQSGQFSAGIVDGFAKFTPSSFALAPGEKMRFTLAVSIPPHLLSIQKPQAIEVRAIGKQTSVLATVALPMPLCTQTQPALFGAPSPTPIQIIQQGFGSVSGQNFLTGFFLARGSELSAFLSGMRGNQINLPGVSLPSLPSLPFGTVSGPSGGVWVEWSKVLIGAAILAILLVVGYAVHTDRQASKQEGSLAQKRRERLSRVKSEVG